MPKTKITTKSQSRKPAKITDISPSLRQASEPMIEKWAQETCANGDDSGAHSAAFLILLDEIERAGNDYQRVSTIVWLAQRAAFAMSNHAEEAKEQFIAGLRAKNGLRIVRKRESATG